ncbi:MAG: Na/Pi cotransporter family protein [Mariprofundaceae bacterium]|nr:Na/Pi cotransporter family protein [Mariprofundaceae bacterium]
MTWQIFTGLAGGIGLFLLGMQMMTDGMKQSAGNSLRTVLKSSTRTPLRGILSGALITSLVQSSSAVTVATIGFVNAGLLTLKQAIRVAYGSNLGTTMTGWLVAIIGFGFHIKTFALPAIGVGMLMTLFARHGRYPAIGKALAGFGLFFLGVDLLKSGFSGLENLIVLDALQQRGIGGLIVFVGVGFLMTLIMQSSSAAIAITLTAAAGGVMELSAAACMVIGANVGTTSTAALAAIGATPNAKRVAAGHVIFNAATGLIALLILPLILMAIEWFRQSSGITGGPATFLALFHTLFNLLGIMLLWPFTDRLVAFLKRQFRAAEEDEARPKYLDSTLIDTPLLAQEALTKELKRIQTISIRMAEDAINTEASLSPRIAADRFVMDRLIDAVGDFTAKLRRTDLPGEVAEALPLTLAATRYFSDVGDLAAEIDKKQSNRVTSISEQVDEVLAENRRLAISVLETLREPIQVEETLVREAATLDGLERSYELVKAQLLRAGTAGKLSVRHMLNVIELSKNIERLVNYSVKGQNALYTFSQSTVAGNRHSGDQAPVKDEAVNEAGTGEPVAVESGEERNKNGSDKAT